MRDNYCIFGQAKEYLDDIKIDVCYIIIKPKFISESLRTRHMIGEAITIAAILGGCAAAVWYAKSKFQPEIEHNLAKIEAVEVQEFVHKKKDHLQ